MKPVFPSATPFCEALPRRCEKEIRELEIASLLAIVGPLVGVGPTSPRKGKRLWLPPS
jgi:hypothetical protein